MAGIDEALSALDQTKITYEIFSKFSGEDIAEAVSELSPKYRRSDELHRFWCEHRGRVYTFHEMGLS